MRCSCKTGTTQRRGHRRRHFRLNPGAPRCQNFARAQGMPTTSDSHDSHGKHFLHPHRSDILSYRFYCSCPRKRLCCLRKNTSSYRNPHMRIPQGATTRHQAKRQNPSAAGGGMRAEEGCHDARQGQSEPGAAKTQCQKSCKKNIPRRSRTPRSKPYMISVNPVGPPGNSNWYCSEVPYKPSVHSWLEEDGEGNEQGSHDESGRAAGM